MIHNAELETHVASLVKSYTESPAIGEVPKWILPPRSCQFLKDLAAILPDPVRAFEFGSGQSTHVLRSVCQAVTSIEDSEEWLAKTENSENSIAKRTDDYSAFVPLSTCWNACRPYNSFNLNDHPLLLERMSASNLILVDSPPNPATREHALLQSLQHAPINALVVVDDLDVNSTRRFCERIARINGDCFSFWLLPIDHQLGVFLKKTARTAGPRSQPTLREIAGQWLRFKRHRLPE